MGICIVSNYISLIHSTFGLKLVGRQIIIMQMMIEFVRV